MKFVGLNPGGQAGFIDHVRITGSPVIGNGVQWLVSDHLGTPRMIIDQTGSLANIKRHDYLPFGEELFAGSGGRTAQNGYVSGDGVRQQFTQKERDVETDLDYFEARYYGSIPGRFTSVDPLGGHTEDPQTLNRYTYARNSPLRFTDPSGLDFYLTCQNESSTCRNGQVGVTDKDGNFIVTLISNDKKGGLVDQYGNVYTAKISGQGVSFNGAGSQEYVLGVFKNGTNTTTIQGSDGLTGFTFTFTSSNLDVNQTAKGTWTFNGTYAQAEAALEKAGYENYVYDNFNIYHPSTDTYNAAEYRSRGDKDTAANSGHFTVHEAKLPIGRFRLPLRLTVPTSGEVHFGEHNPWVNLRGTIKHGGELTRP